MSESVCRKIEIEYEKKVEKIPVHVIKDGESYLKALKARAEFMLKMEHHDLNEA